MQTTGVRYSVPRGAPTRVTGHMERLHRAWIDALAASSGCEVWTDNVLDDGIDVMLKHKHPGHAQSPAIVDVQLKATTSRPGSGVMKVQMTRKRALEMAVATPTVPMIVAILTMPQAQEHWTFTNKRSLVLFGQCYWVNLAGMDFAGSSDKVTIQASIGNLLDDVSLAQMMARIGQGGAP